jgi:hypothetical protein
VTSPVILDRELDDRRTRSVPRLRLSHNFFSSAKSRDRAPSLLADISLFSFHTRLVAPGTPSCHVPWPRLMVSSPDIQLRRVPGLTAWACICPSRYTGDLGYCNPSVRPSADLSLGRISFWTRTPTVTGVSVFYQFQKSWTAVAVPDR